MRRTSRSTVVTTGLLILLSGCAGQSSDTRPDAAPAEGSELTSEEWIGHAQEILTGRCMREQGFEYYVETPTARKPGTTHRFTYGIDDVSWAAEHGLARSDDDKPADPAPDKNAQYARGLSAAEQRRYTAAYAGDPSKHHVETSVAGIEVGTSTTGCLAAAKKELFGDLRAWHRPHVISRNLNALTHRRVVRDSRFLRATENWSDCMRGRGTTAASPDDLRQRLVRRSRQLSPTKSEELERRWAISEATCSIRTGLIKTARALETTHKSAVREKYRSELKALDAIEARAAQRARSIAHSS